MADYRAERSIGARIAAARRSRGFRTTKELAAAMANTGITAAVLENIESGRKSNLDISQVLTIARVLDVPFVNLLAPMSRPGDIVDLPNLGADLGEMTADEFDAWMSSTTGASYVPRSARERYERSELQALRDLRAAERELLRLEVAQRLEAVDLASELRDASKAALEATRRQVADLRSYLSSAGWEL